MSMEEEKKKKMSSSNNNGEMKKKLPIGFRFRPTDEELLIHYLKRKTLSLPLPASVIPDHLLPFHSHPSSLPGNLREKRYYFWKRPAGNCSRIMAASSGFWKAVGKGKQVISRNDVVGSRKSWVFYQISNDFPHGHCSKTRWFMHEFQILETQNRQAEEKDYWVVCRIFQRKIRPENKIKSISEKIDGMRKRDECKMGIVEFDSPCSIDFRVGKSFELGPPQPSSPCSISDSC